MNSIVKNIHNQFQPRACTARKRDKFGVNFNAIIQVEGDSVQPCKEIFGRVIINTGTPIKCKEMLIQYEVFFTLPIAKKMVGSVAGVRQSILGKHKPGPGGYQESPVKQVILQDIEGAPGTLHIISELQAFVFTLTIPGNVSLPRSFNFQGYSLVHRLALYMKSSCSSYVEVAEKIVKCEGYYNLLYNAVATKCITATETEHPPLFLGKKWATATFSLESSGFVLGESIPFVLHVKCEKKVRMELAAWVMFEAKIGDSLLLTFEGSGHYSEKKKSVHQHRQEFTWKDMWEIPTKEDPTFIAHSMLKICHNVQFKVKFWGHAEELTGKAPIFIGSTREPPSVAISSCRVNCLEISGTIESNGMESRSVGLRDSSRRLSLPPAYSQLSSRAPSLETLPPAYDELMMATHSKQLNQI